MLEFSRSFALRFLLVLVVAAVNGCGKPATVAEAQEASPANAAIATDAAANGATEAANPPPLAPPSETAGELPPDLGTRPGGTDWPGFLGPSGDSKSTETGILTDWPAEGLKIVWQQPTGTSYAMPSISRGRLFQFARFGDLARVTCQESETGKFIWKFEYPTDFEDLYNYDNGPRCCPVVDDDRVYLHGAEGMLHCLRAVDGALIWKVDTVQQFGVVQNFFGVSSVPVIEGDLLIVHVGGSPAESQHVPPGQLDLVVGNGSGIVAFNKFTGQVEYQLSDELASYASPTLATIDGRRWCFILARGGLLAFDPTTGVQDFFYPWRAKTLESVNASNAVVVGDRVLISECYGPGSSLLRVAPGRHDLIWSDQARRRDKALQTHWNTPIHLDGYVYASSGRHSNEAELRCVELETGKVMWAEPGLGRCSLMYADGHFFCQAETGELLLLEASPEGFKKVAEMVPTLNNRRLIRPPAWAAPILSHGLLYVRGDKHLVCVEVVAGG